MGGLAIDLKPDCTDGESSNVQLEKCLVKICEALVPEVEIKLVSNVAQDSCDQFDEKLLQKRLANALFVKSEEICNEGNLLDRILEPRPDIKILDASGPAAQLRINSYLSFHRAKKFQSLRINFNWLSLLYMN